MSRFIFLNCLLFSFNLLFSQEKIHLKRFMEEVQKKQWFHWEQVDFYRSQSFFFKEEWDSTLIYSMKVLASPGTDPEFKDYCHYFRGISFKKKTFRGSQKGIQIHFARVPVLSPGQNIHGRAFSQTGKLP